MASALIVIPARFDAARLPGKPLVDLCGVPMIVRVLRLAQQVKRASRVIVATDDARIAAAVTGDGGEAMMTASTHVSGTDRVFEVVQRLGWSGLVVNVQGDEPLLDPGSVDALIEGLAQDPNAEVATLAAPLEGAPDVASRVKVVFDANGRALYFSRQPIPTGGPWWQHVGMYAFRAPTLEWFAQQPPGRLEQAERLEQLRLIEGGVSITIVRIRHASISVDTPDDLMRVRSLLNQASSEGLDA
ncbi:MAG: 3-deoxy-manno-octulosonate cytidylyltransferase [Myxococcota bacterium]